MAELVQRNIELSLADLEPMETNGICSQQEVIQILQKRRNYEYKLLRKPPRKGDYLSSIQYEVYLYMLFSKRKNLHTDKSKTNPFGRYVYSANRIHILFTRVLRRFKSDLSLWLQYADFCKRARHYSRLSKCITKAVRIHPRCSGLWSLGAWTALTFDSDTQTARVLLLRGLRVLPDDQHLWLQLFRLEILYVYKIEKRQAMLKLHFFEEKVESSSDDKELPYKAAHLVYTQAIEQIPGDPDFRYQFIQLLRDYKDTESLQDIVYHGLKEDFADNPTVWLFLAKQPVYRYMDTQRVEWNAALGACESDVEKIFQEAIEICPTSGDIWEEYLKIKNEIISYADVFSRREKVQSFIEIVKRLNQAGISNENIHVMYVTLLKSEGLLQEMEDFIVQLGKKALEMPLLLEAVVNDSDIRHKVISLVLDVLKDGNIELYSTIIRNVTFENLSLVLSEEQVNKMFETLYKSSLKYQYDDIGELLLRLLHWSAANEPMHTFRSRYNKLLTQSSCKWPLKLYLFCSEVEKKCEPINESELDLIFEKMIDSYGSGNVNVWLEYIDVKKFVKNYTGAGDCYWRAMKSLNPDLVEEFVNRYTLSSLS